MTHTDVQRGAYVYSPKILHIYDALVLSFSNPVAWKCPTLEQLQHYNDYLSHAHLDVGPGTGWYLAHAPLERCQRLALLDLNPNSLTATVQRLNRDIETYHHNVLEPFDIPVVSSIGINYVYHCLPGNAHDKGQAFIHLARILTDDGVLFGSTILGNVFPHRGVGAALMKLYNHKGIFHNTYDTCETVEQSLRLAFHDVTVTQRGAVALFVCRTPRRT